MVETRFHWFLPTSGDSRGVVGGEHGAEVLSSSPVREPELAYLRQVAQAAEANRFDSVLTPTGLYCRDPWLTAAALAEHTPSLRFLVAMRPDALSPTLAAQMAATFQAQTGGGIPSGTTPRACSRGSIASNAGWTAATRVASEPIGVKTISLRLCSGLPHQFGLGL